jgi:carbamate kinase
LDWITVAEVKEMEAAGQFPPGSMGPKVEAAREFIGSGGTEAVVCKPTDLVDAFSGNAGTRVVSIAP